MAWVVDWTACSVVAPLPLRGRLLMLSQAVLLWVRRLVEWGRPLWQLAWPLVTVLR